MSSTAKYFTTLIVKYFANVTIRFHSKLILYLPSRNSGVEIPYPQITLHAITTASTSERKKQQAIYMQIDPHGSHSFDDHGAESLEVTMIPPISTDETTALELY